MPRIKQLPYLTRERGGENLNREREMKLRPTDWGREKERASQGEKGERSVVRELYVYELP